MPLPGEIYEHHRGGRFVVVGTARDDASGGMNVQKVVLRHLATGSLETYSPHKFAGDVSDLVGGRVVTVARFRLAEG